MSEATEEIERVSLSDMPYGMEALIVIRIYTAACLRIADSKRKKESTHFEMCCMLFPGTTRKSVTVREWYSYFFISNVKLNSWPCHLQNIVVANMLCNNLTEEESFFMLDAICSYLVPQYYAKEMLGSCFPPCLCMQPFANLNYSSKGALWINRSSKNLYSTYLVYFCFQEIVVKKLS